MTVYAVFREGNYRHECGGVFSTLELAKQAADWYADNEPDGRHGWHVVPFELDCGFDQDQPSGIITEPDEVHMAQGVGPFYSSAWHGDSKGKKRFPY